MLHCANSNCQAANPINSDICQNCGTPLVRRYLWIAGVALPKEQVAQMVAGRYLIKHPRIVLDTKPALVPQFTEDIPPQIVNYLKLFPYRLHVPQVYGLASPTYPLWFLETAAVAQGVLAPPITKVWAGASPLRQLHWLKQIAQLWQPCSENGVISSLLNWELLRVQGPLVNLLELQLDGQPTPKLRDLGLAWQVLATYSNPLTDFLACVAQQLEQGEIATSGELVAVLAQAIANQAGVGQHHYTFICATDKGPNREINEDSCYPKPDELGKGEAVLVIVCDGIGGHEGGEVASRLAIDSLEQQLNHPSGQQIPAQICQEIYTANRVINDRNDQENRQSRQRMGTTLVLAKGVAHQLYIAHVGDSRAYWITKQGCYPITVDDDIASREVRLGYALYRDVLRHQSAGSLVQAVGMMPAESLHPHVNELVIDEDCVILLCSDGLSDYDRVEQYWQREILPILTEQRDLTATAQRLIAIANEKNGHDNATVALIHCQFQGEPSLNEAIPLAPTRIMVPPKRSLPWGVGLLSALGLGAGLGVWYWFNARPTPPVVTTNPSPQPSNWQVGDRLRLKVATTVPTTANPQQRLDLPPGTILQVAKQTTAPDQEERTELLICSSPNPGVAGSITLVTSALPGLSDPAYPRRSQGRLGRC